MLISGQLAIVDASKYQWQNVTGLNVNDLDTTDVSNGTVVVIIEKPDFLNESTVQYVMTPCGKCIIVEDSYLRAA